MDDDLTRLAAAVRERELLEPRRAGLSAAILRLSTELTVLRRRQAAEQRDVERLESLSLTRILVSLRGARGSTLERERAEAEAARYRAAQAQDQIDALRAQLAEVTARLAATGSVPASYNQALAREEKRLSESGAGPGGRLAEIAEQRGRAEAELRELTEASNAARKTTEALTAANALIESADTWSDVDTFLNGGLITSMVKNSRLDDAAGKAAEADRCLAVLRAELGDVGQTLSPTGDLSIGGVTRFADVFLDNILTDLHVRSQIGAGLDQIGRTARQVGQIQATLTARIAELRGRLRTLEAERNALLKP